MVQTPEVIRNLRQWAALSWHVVRPAAYGWRDETPVQPFYIVGSGRCGTTLLRRLLVANSQVHIPPENWAYGGWIQTFRRYRAVLPWHDLVHLLLSKFMVNNHGFFDRYPSDLLGELLELPPQHRNLAAFIHTVYSHHGRSCGVDFTRWGDKTPLNVGHMEDILRVFPKAQFIFLLRDGIDVAYSWSFLDKYKGELIQPAQRWRQAFHAARDFGARHPDRLLELQYEALVKNPKENTERVLSFLRLDKRPALAGNDELSGAMADALSTPHLQNVFRPVSVDSIGKGRRELSDLHQRQVSAVIGDELVKAGYEPVG